jgi:MarR family transcriptional regulator, lower aerobic nicotinate degradation pathway regulator
MALSSTRKLPAASSASEARRKTASPSAADALLENVIYSKPGFLVRRMQQIGVSIFLEETKEFDITPLQYGVLAAVRATPGIDQIGVSNKVGLDRTTIVGIVDRLERKELLLRRADPADRRVRQLFLSSAGQQRLLDMRGATERVQKRLLEPLDEKERVRFTSYMKRIIDHHNEDSRVPINDPTLRGTITSRADGEDA